MDNTLNLEAMKNLNSYNAEMAKSSYDKLGFVDRIFDNIDTVVDFGCADGSVTELLRFYYPKAKIIGYDIAEIQNPSTTSTVIY